MSSPFFQKDPFGHNPFVYKNEVYRFNPTVVSKKEVLTLLTPEEKFILNFDYRLDWPHPESSRRLPDDRPIIVGIISRVFDEPFLGIEVSGDTPEAENFRQELIGMNGIEFHRAYYTLMIKETFEHVLKQMIDIDDPDKLNEEDFLFAFCLNFFARYLLGPERMREEDRQRAQFFRKAFDAPNAFDYEFLAASLPGDREEKHFLVWER